VRAERPEYRAEAAGFKLTAVIETPSPTGMAIIEGKPAFMSIRQKLTDTFRSYDGQPFRNRIEERLLFKRNLNYLNF
jgi:hypothetical protein